MIKISDYSFDESLYYYLGGEGHIWLKKLPNGNVKIGFDDFGQKLAGKILFVRTIPVGKDKEKGKSIGTIETGKFVGAIRSPVTGVVSEINEELKNNPSIINDDPYGKGWIAVIKPTNLEADLKQEFIFGAESIKKWINEEIKRHVNNK